MSDDQELACCLPYTALIPRPPQYWHYRCGCTAACWYACIL